MLLAVEGGRFFSSSASGYSNGLNILLLGHKKEEKPMRVTPWTQYHLVDQESDPDLQLAANKNRCICGCASFVCFGRAAAGLDTASVGPNQQQQDVRKTSVDLEHVDDNIRTSNFVDDDSNTRSTNVSSLKSSLKRQSTTVPVSFAVNSEGEVEPVHLNGSSVPGHIGRRSVHWTDVTGGELFQIREFEPSEHSGSDDELENGNARTCSCRIM